MRFSVAPGGALGSGCQEPDRQSRSTVEGVWDRQSGVVGAMPARSKGRNGQGTDVPKRRGCAPLRTGYVLQASWARVAPIYAPSGTSVPLLQPMPDAHASRAEQFN
jgi:hypothetical protein